MHRYWFVEQCGGIHSRVNSLMEVIFDALEFRELEIRRALIGDSVWDSFEFHGLAAPEPLQTPSGVWRPSYGVMLPQRNSVALEVFNPQLAGSRRVNLLTEHVEDPRVGWVVVSPQDINVSPTEDRGIHDIMWLIAETLQRQMNSVNTLTVQGRSPGLYSRCFVQTLPSIDRFEWHGEFSRLVDERNAQYSGTDYDPDEDRYVPVDSTPYSLFDNGELPCEIDGVGRGRFFELFTLGYVPTNRRTDGGMLVWELEVMQ